MSYESDYSKRSDLILNRVSLHVLVKEGYGRRQLRAQERDVAASNKSNGVKTAD